MSSLQKLEVEQRLRLVLLRNRGVIRDTIEDYEREFGQRLSQDYVLRVYRKFRREVRQDNLRWVSYHFAQEFIAQSAKVQHQLSKQLQEYNERSVKLLSVCCSSIVKPHPCEEGAYLCLGCDTQCEVEEVMDKSIERLKLQVIDKLQKEQDLTMRFLEGMGFLQKRSGQGVLNVGVERTPDALPAGNAARVPQKPDIDPDLQKELDSLDPRDAQMMLDGDLELTVEFEDDKDEASGQKITDN